MYCRKEGARLLIDDRDANRKAKEYGIKTLTIPDLLFLGEGVASTKCEIGSQHNGLNDG